MNANTPFSRRTFLAGTAAAAAASLLARGTRAQTVPASAPADQKKLGIAVVGIGTLSTGQIIPALMGTGGGRGQAAVPMQYCKLVAFVTGHRDKNLPLAQRCGIAPEHVYTYDNFDSIKNNPDIDIVYVVTPNSIHKENVLTAAKAGKHVLCEKPMATSVADCQTMIDAVKAAGKQLMVAYRMQYEPLTLKLTDIARDKDKIGKISHIDAVCNTNRSRDNASNIWRLQLPLSGGGALMDLGIYAQNSVRYLSGEEPTEVNVTKYDPPDGGTTGAFQTVERTIVFDLKFASGLTATVTSSYAMGGNRTQLTGEKGSLDLNPLMNYTGNKAYYTPTGGQRSEVTYTWKHHFATEMDDFARRLMDGKPSKTPGEEGLRDMRIIYAAYESAKTGKPVKLV